MGEINIKSPYYCFGDMANIEDFHSKLLKIDKKSHRDINIYYIGYITIKKIGDCENIYSVNPLYLIIHSATEHFQNGEKYLIIDSTEKYEEVWSGIRSKIETRNGGKELFYEKNYARIGVNTDDDLPLNVPRKFPALAVIIRCVLQKGKKVYSQTFYKPLLINLFYAHIRAIFFSQTTF